MLARARFSDPKTDIYLAANVVDAVVTYMALQSGSQLTEFNSIIYASMNTIGIGLTLFLKVVLCIGVLWLLRRSKKEKLLVPIAVVLGVIALANLTLARLHGIEI
ncbi:MAG: DUF5658 family protein [Dehalococcoidia bacterium]